MNFKQLKDIFFSELSGIYSEEELNVFFYMLIEEYTGLSKIEIIQLSTDQKRMWTLDSGQWTDSIQRLKKFEPIQYIIGKTYFYNSELKVTPDVLIPRPETEELVDIIIKDIRKINSQQSTADTGQWTVDCALLKILDIGTGSGCIAIALKKAIPEAEVYAMDISEKAIQIAKQNAEYNNVNINFFKADITKVYRPQTTIDSGLWSMDFDIIVSNPPYVRESEKKLMNPNVLQYEPEIVLFVKDVNPLYYYEYIINFALENFRNFSKVLNFGKVYLEINENLSNELISLLKSKGFNNIALKHDLFDKPRFIIITKDNRA